MTYTELWTEFIKEFSGYNARQEKLEKLDKLILRIDKITIEKFQIDGVEIKLGGNTNVTTNKE